MILKSLKLENFRSYKNIEINFDDNLNVIIGKNDIGKSTILEALDIFFGQDKIKIEIEDKNVFQGSEIAITCEFKIDPTKSYLIDSEVKTNLKDEFLLNKDGCLEIKKIWDCSKNKITASSLKTYIICEYPSELANFPLPTMKINELKKLLEDVDNHQISFALHDKLNNNELEGLTIGPFSSGEDSKIPVDIDKRKRADIRKAIYSVLEGVRLTTIKLPLDKEDSKNIWNSISADLPLFFLFQSDRANKDTDKEVQDPLKAITKTAIEDVRDMLEDVKRLITESAEKIGNETIEKLKEMNPELGKILKPDVSNKAWDTLFSFSFLGDDNIPMNKRGSGVRRLILINYFRAEAERKNKSDREIIYAIEEPETAQHPDHQILLINALIDLSQKKNNQVLITTHSPEIAKQAKDENLILIDKIDGENKIVQEENKLSSIVNTLGIIPYLGKLIICVEGENDVKFLTNINKGISELNDIISLEERNIKIIPMKGSALKSWIDRQYLAGSNIIEYHLYDRDSDEKYKQSIEKVNKRPNAKGRLTNKRELENYIPKDFYEQRFNIDLSDVSDWDTADIPQLVFNKCRKFDSEGVIKEITNGSLSKQLRKEHLEQLDCFEEVKSWFIDIKELSEQ